MKIDELKKIIEQGENDHIEFKTGNISPEFIAREVCAFLNCNGGRLLIGIGDKGELIGVSDSEFMMRQIENTLPQLISPRALWSVEQNPIDDKRIVVVEVPEGMDKPYVAAGAIYFRRNERVIPATRDEISALIKKSTAAGQRWERQIAIGADREDLDEKLIRETARMAVGSARWQGVAEDTEAFLNALGLVMPGGVTNAALVLYGKKPSRVLPQARVRLLVMPKGKTGDIYSVDKMFDSCLLRIFKEIPDALTAYAGGVESSFSSENWQRSDRSLYPMTALREGIMNALVHRNYESSGSITISVLPDTLKISNPGGLPDDLKPVDLKRDHSSLPRNPDIAHICFLHRLIEKVGRGTQCIVEDCREARLKEPKWTSSPLETTLTFFSPSKEGHQDNLSDRQIKILDLLKQKDSLKAMEIVSNLGEGITDRTVRNDLLSLIENGLVIRRGQGPNTKYAFINQKLK